MSDAVPLKSEHALRLRDVQARVGNPSKSTLYSWAQQGKFPRPFKLNGISVWLASEIDAWLTEQVRSARHELQAVGAA